MQGRDQSTIGHKQQFLWSQITIPACLQTLASCPPAKEKQCKLQRTASDIMPDTPGREHDQDQWWNVTKYIYSGVLLICSSDVMFCSFSILSENVVFCTPCYSFKV